jgi:hypothetical protein
MRSAIATFTLLVAPAMACAMNGSAPCSLTDQQFSEQVDALVDWPSIYSHQARHFPPCPDEGMYAQAHSELIVRILLARWSQLPELSLVVREHPDFKNFVLRHVNARAAKSDLQTILTYSTIRCPREQGRLCTDLRASAAAALQALQ